MSIIDLNALRFGLVILFLSVSVVLNSLGFYCLRRTKNKVDSSTAKQHLMLSFLSLSELCYSFLALGKWILNYNGLNEADSWVYRVFVASVFSSFYVYCCLLLVILANRFLLIAFPLNHAKILSSRRLWYTVMALWILSYSLAIPLGFMNLRSWSLYISIAYVAIEVLVLLFTVITFSFIGYKLRKLKNTSYQSDISNPTGNQQQIAGNKRCRPDSASRGQLKLITLALLTLFSFLPLVVIPDLIVMILLHTSGISKTLIDFIYSMLNLNFVMDPLAYIMTYPLVFRQLKEVFKRRAFMSTEPDSQELYTIRNQFAVYKEFLQQNTRL